MVHKTANVLGTMSRSLHEKAKSDLQDIWMAETKKEGNAAFDLFVETYGVKHEKVVTKLIKDRDELAFCDFPAEHWKHIRTTNPVESVFATVRNRIRKTKGYLSRKTALAMVFRLMMSAKKKWRKISGPNRLPEVIQASRRATPVDNSLWNYPWFDSYEGLSSKAGSSNFKLPPDDGRHQLLGIAHEQVEGVVCFFLRLCYPDVFEIGLRFLMQRLGQGTQHV